MIVGKYSYGTENIEIKWNTNKAKLVIGNFASIAGNIVVYLGGNHKLDFVTTYPFGRIHQKKFNTFNGGDHPYTKGDVIIGNDVWIANNVTIMSGVTIGDGAIIANNQPYELYAAANTTNDFNLLKYVELFPASSLAAEATG